MDIHHLRVFASVFRHRSFSRAAEELRLAQPTVSDHIRAIEEELNCRLFDRLGRKIIPTPEAGALIGRAGDIIERVDGIGGLLGEFRKDLSGRLVVGASTIPGTYILPGFAASFGKINPSVFFEAVVSDSRAIIDKVSGHELLMGIVGSRLEAKQVHYEPFLEDELTVVAPGPAGPQKKMTLRELSDAVLVLREEGSGTRREFERILERERIDPHRLRIAGIFGSTDAVKQAVKEGMGISIVSRRSVRDELKCGLLNEVRIKDSEMRRRFYIVTHQKRSLPHLYKAFREHLRAAR